MNTYFNFKLLYIAVLLPLPALAGGTYKWVDERGVTHYGDAIPPAYVNAATTELSKKGLVVRQTAPALTDEQRQARQAELDRRNEEAQRAREQRRRDNALLNTYTSVSEIDLTRDRNLQQAELSQSGIETRRKVVAKRLSQLRTEAANYKNNKKPVPAQLKEDMARVQAEIDRLQASLDKGLREIEAIKARFAADRMRYQELTQVAAKR